MNPLSEDGPQLTINIITDRGHTTKRYKETTEATKIITTGAATTPKISKTRTAAKITKKKSWSTAIEKPTKFKNTS